ncbi:PAS domain-containing protein [Pseudoroseomonas wenyumeiae]
MNPSNPAIGKDTYELLIHGLTDYAIYMLAPDGRVISWNPGAERIKGYTADEIIGEHFSRFYTEEDRAAGAPARTLITAAEAGRFHTEAWRVRRDGSRFWANVVVDPIRQAGEPHRLCQDHAGHDGAAPSPARHARERAPVPPAGPERHRLRHLHAELRRVRFELECRC